MVMSLFSPELGRVHMTFVNIARIINVQKNRKALSLSI